MWSSITFVKGINVIGNNQPKTHPFCAQFGEHPHNIFFHAETNAIYNALKIVDEPSLKKSKLFIYRVKKEKPFSKTWIKGISYPCKSCMNAIQKYKIPKVIYTTDGGVDILNF